MKKNNIKEILINHHKSVIETLKLLNKTKEKCLIVVDFNNKFLGTITDGDIRRSIIKKRGFEKNISKIYKKNAFFVLEKKYDKDKTLNFIKKKKYNLIPILNNQNKPIDYFSNERFGEEKTIKKQDYPIMLMAGGEGKRMQPFTSVLPKPLIPINKKPVIVHIMNLFKKYNFDNINISLSYKSIILKSYLNEIKEIFSFTFFEEKKPLGTAGILKKFKTKAKNFFLINCDGLFNINVNRLVEFHEENRNDLTIVTALKNIEIPYGVCDLEKKGILKKIDEKPTKSFLVNTGFYLCKSNILDKLPRKKQFDMDILIKKLIKDKMKVSIFPIKDKDWQDVGNWSDYLGFKKFND